MFYKEEIKKFLLDERENFFSLIAVCFITGILTCFTNIFPILIKPAKWLTIYYTILLTAVLTYLYYKNYHRKYIAFIALILAYFIGISVFIIRVETVRSTVLETQYQGWITGKVTEILATEKSDKLLIEPLIMSKLKKTDMPKKVRIIVRRAKNTNIKRFDIGDIIRVKAVINSLNGPIMPNKFDFSEFAFFRQIGGIGYAVSKVYKVSSIEQNPYSIIGFMNKMRHAIILHLRTNINQPAAGIALGLLVGDTGFIDEQTNEYFRISGIAHLIAISGMHMVLIIGMIFTTVRWLILRVSDIALRINSKKVAAIIAIIGSYFYLLLAGQPISAQRAFLVSLIWLIAVLIDRDTLSLRSLISACLIILFFAPESVKSASLQMSFAACLGLISGSTFYNNIIKRLNIHNTYLRYILLLTGSSIMAGMSSLPFIIYHFNYISTYSVLTNILCVPLNDFIIMPIGIIGLLLIPLHLDFIPFYLMEKLINQMIKIAAFISNLNYSSIYIANISDIGILLIAFGGFVFCVSRTKIYLLGLICCIMSFYIGYQSYNFDIIILASGNNFIIKHDDKYFLSSKRKSRYESRVVGQYLGVKQWETLATLKSEVCNEKQCLYKKLNKKIMIWNEEGVSITQDSCKDIDLFINMKNDQKCEGNIQNLMISEGNQYMYFITIGHDNINVQQHYNVRAQF